MTRISEWRRLPVSLNELCLATTLRCGQSFRWRQCDDQTWACTLRGRIVQLSQPDKLHIEYRSIWPAAAAFEVPLTPPSSIPPTTVSDESCNSEIENDDTRNLIQHYLNLEPNLETLYAQWSASDANFRRKAPKFTGVRILRQDAWEALIGFICSSNNNIIRISQMVDKLCTHYGTYIGTLDGRPYHDFPEPSALTGKNVESNLRELGFGYRAKYIYQTAKIIADDREVGWLDTLRNPESPAYGTTKPSPAGEMKPEGRDGYRQAHENLLGLQGVGPKVADCVCLMGLGWGEAVPVDTHVWQIAQRDYKLEKGKNTSMTKGTYDAVANHFRKIWGKEAGWAHSVLFTADLRTFAERLTTKVEVSVEQGGGEQREIENDGPLKVVRKQTAQRVSLKRKAEQAEPKTVMRIEEVRTTNSSERVQRRRRRR
ncbi:N-glycosylase/DNA lyase [Cladophialophora psammophila CBS 110553]|uniref:DNA-(apurinic or apyrimidinic site) lyase n=1 Tax=Cladophialophora psammophila CBS 110553 TaxID=1182543 RepID=W9X6C8_9EURO|nr:N-glycosylase/DNA lyase [Cladophialophora psammophila CBS 110553]EXJ72860.1 N-glycosylase/DNA lyase [Cladophialophora psammophila CBS 110553]